MKTTHKLKNKMLFFSISVNGKAFKKRASQKTCHAFISEKLSRKEL
jgi:hypothetical protein